MLLDFMEEEDYVDFQDATIIYEGTSDIMVALKAQDIVNAETIKESPIVQAYLEGGLTGNTAPKKLLAAAIAIADDKCKVLPEKYANPQSIGAMADKAVETVKLAHDVATGKTTTEKVADFVTKKAAAVVKTAANKIVNHATDIAAVSVATTVAAVFPPAAIVTAPIAFVVTKFCGEKAKQAISKGINKIAEAVKPVVRKAVEIVKETAKTVWNGVKNVGRKVLSFFGL